MLPKDKRLNLKTDFKWVAEGSSVNSKSFKLFYRSGGNILPKLGVALSSKYFKKAHQRNRSKRLMHTVFNSLYSRLKTNLNIIALPNSRVFEVKSDSLEKELLEVFEKAGLVNEKTSVINN